MVDHTMAALRRAGLDEHRIRSEKYEDPFTQQPSAAAGRADSPELVRPAVSLGVQ